MTSPIKIAVLDDYQGISEPVFKALDPATYEVTVFRDTLLPYSHPATSQKDKDKLVQRLERFNIICTMRERTPFPGALITRLPNLKLILTTGMRNASLDLPAFKAAGIPVAGTKNQTTLANSDSTTTHTVALILAAARGITIDDANVRAGGWQTVGAATLTGKVFGTLGLGRLGARVARIMHLAFGMRVVAWSTHLTQEAADEQAVTAGLPVALPDGEKTFKFVDKDELLRTADVVSLHLVLSERSRGIVAARDLALLKPSAILVNTSRAPLIVEKDLLALLETGRIRTTALDVFDLEPLPTSSPWRTTPWGTGGRSQVVTTAHMGYVETEALQAWYHAHVDNILRWGEGEPVQLLYE